MWKMNNPPQLQFWYFPGPDNVAHNPEGGHDGSAFQPWAGGVGGASQDAIISKQIKDVTDERINKAWTQIQAAGYQDAVVFVTIADHGLIVTPHQRLTDVNTVNGSTPQTDETQIVNLLTEVYRRSSTRIVPGGVPFTPNVWRGGNQAIDDAHVVHAPSGGLAHVYLAAFETHPTLPGRVRSVWRSPPLAENVREVARVLRLESLGTTSIYDGQTTANDQTFRNALAIINGVPAILIKPSGFGDAYQLDRVFGPEPLPNGMSPNGTTAGGQWIDATYRMLQETNDTRSPSRSGDLVLLMNSTEGAIAVAEADQLPGWHGSPSKTESQVPMMWASPMSRPTGVAGIEPSDVAQQIQTIMQGREDGYLRTRQFKGLLQQVLEIPK